MVNSATCVEPRLATIFSGGVTLTTLLSAFRDCAGENDTRTAAVSATSTLVQITDDLFLIVILAYQALMHCSDGAVAIDDERSRQGLYSTIRLRKVVVSNRDSVIDLVFLEIGLHDRPAV